MYLIYHVRFMYGKTEIVEGFLPYFNEKDPEWGHFHWCAREESNLHTVAGTRT